MMKDSFSRMSVPQRRYDPLTLRAVKRFFEIVHKSFEASQSVAADSHRNRPLRIWPEGQAGCPKERGLLLETSRVCEDEPGVFRQAK